MLSPLSQGRELKFIDDANRVSGAKSPLSQGRELKYHLVFDVLLRIYVAPLAGARIEIRLVFRPSISPGSPLSQGQELKLHCSGYSGTPRLSPLSQGRELKLDVTAVPFIVESRPSRRGEN